MTVISYFLYLAAVAVLVLTPGPTMLMCATNALHHGRVPALASAAGALVAAVATMALSAVGLGAVLAASATAFTVLKVAGAAYLIWLGIRTFRGRVEALADDAPQERGRSMFVQGLLVGASNPKALLFFAAFFPQFIDPQAAALPQFALLCATWVLVDGLMLTACAFGVGWIAPMLRDATLVRWINRACGGLFTLMGGLLLFSRRSA